MLIVDTMLRKRAAEGDPVRVAMVGAGFMASGIANQIVNSVPGMRLVAIANRTLGNAVRAYRQAVIEEVEAVESVAALEDCIRAGRYAVTGDPELLCLAEGVDCLLDVTGALEYGARFTMK